MNALWLEDGKVSYRTDLPLPAGAEGEVLVRVELAGICGTDLELIEGYAGFRGVPGHEFVGTVTDAPASPGLVGKRVVGEINISCGECVRCAAGMYKHCERRSVLGIRARNGAFAEFLTLPGINLHVVPDGMPDRHAVLAEPLAAALEILDSVTIVPENRVAVVGAGKLGQLVVRVLETTGCELVAFARHQRQRDSLSAHVRVLDDPADLAGWADVVVEATGNAGGLEDALGLVRPRGAVVLKSTFSAPAAIDLAKVVVNELRLVGSRCGDLKKALSMLASGTVAVDDLIDGEYPLSEWAAAFEHANRPGALKVLIVP